MFERIVEIILFLMKELKTNKQLSDVDVSSLSKNGYTQSEISSAFSWLFDKMAESMQGTGAGVSEQASHRVLHEAERAVVTPEAFGYLLQFQQLGLFSNAEIEMILERILAAGFSEVGIPEMKSFVAGMLFQMDESAPANRLFLGNEDTIH